MALYKRLYDNVLHSGGFVFILHPHFTSREPSAYCRVMQRVISSENSEAFITDREVVDAVLSVGFELCYERTYDCHVNVEDIDDVVLSLFYVHQKVVTLESVRQICQGSVWRLQAMTYGWESSRSRKRNAGELANNFTMLLLSFCHSRSSRALTRSFMGVWMIAYVSFSVVEVILISEQCLSSFDFLTTLLIIILIRTSLAMFSIYSFITHNHCDKLKVTVDVLKLQPSCFQHFNN